MFAQFNYSFHIYPHFSIIRLKYFKSIEFPTSHL